MKITGKKIFKIIIGVITLSGISSLIMVAYNGAKLIPLAKEYTVSHDIYAMEIKDTVLSSFGSEDKYRIVSKGVYKYGEKIVNLESKKHRHYIIELPIKSIAPISFEKTKKPLYFSGMFFDPLHIRNARTYFPIRNNNFQPAKNIKIGYDGEISQHDKIQTIIESKYIVLKADDEKVFEISFINNRGIDVIIMKNENSIQLLLTPHN